MHNSCATTSLQKYIDNLFRLFAHRSAVVAIAVALATIVIAIGVAVTEPAYRYVVSPCNYYHFLSASTRVDSEHYKQISFQYMIVALNMCNNCSYSKA